MHIVPYRHIFGHFLFIIASRSSNIFWSFDNNVLDLYNNFSVTIARNLALCCGFWNNDLLDSTSLTMNTSSDVACVYNLATQTQQIWLNGLLDGSHSSPPYQGTNGHTTIGVGYLTPPGSNFFNGYFGQMEFFLCTKNTTEI